MVGRLFFPLFMVLLPRIQHGAPVTVKLELPHSGVTSCNHPSACCSCCAGCTQQPGIAVARDERSEDGPRGTGPGSSGAGTKHVPLDHLKEG